MSEKQVSEQQLIKQIGDIKNNAEIIKLIVAIAGEIERIFPTDEFGSHSSYRWLKQFCGVSETDDVNYIELGLITSGNFSVCDGYVNDELTIDEWLDYHGWFLERDAAVKFLRDMLDKYRACQAVYPGDGWDGLPEEPPSDDGEVAD